MSKQWKERWPSLEVWVLVLAVLLTHCDHRRVSVFGIANNRNSNCDRFLTLTYKALPELIPVYPKPQTPCPASGLYTCCFQCQKHLTTSFSLVAILQIPTETSLA